ncbi:MAG TPA: class I SAM-dependent methyltransferase [Paucimonas sp.]|nr:class I SAM-dependent methyltransferase [Paucimonas sp.]
MDNRSANVADDSARSAQAASAGMRELLGLLSEAERLAAAGKPADAVPLYRAWLAGTDSPLAYVIHFNLGVALNDAGDRAAAEQSYRAALAVKPDFIEAHLNLGTLLEQQGRIDEALAQWRRVPALDDACLAANRPLHLQALNNLARRLEIDKRLHEAEQLLTQSLLLEPNQPQALQHWIHLRQKQCAWPVFKELPGVTVERMLQSISALSSLSAFDDPAMQLAVARRFVAAKVDTRLPALAERAGYAHARLRIGYLSSDFCLHPVALLTAELFELHDRNKVEVYGFCWSREDGSPVRRRVIGAMDRYIPIGHMSDEEAARCIRAHEIDILVDLHGLTSGVRPDILARRPAPVQVTYLGFPGTTAMPAIDYVVADEFVLPPELRPHFAEQPLLLPHCFQPSDRRREIAPAPTRAECGLPDGAFVFCSFNNNYKFTPEVFACWMRILHAVPDSVLWLLADNEWAQRNLCAEAERQGIDRARLVFASRVAPAAYLARYRVADLFLDTVPFNAGTTANDALWAGLPLLTCAGRTFASRMAGSLLTAIGLPELIATDLSDYESKAIGLGRDRARIAALKQRIAANRASAPLFDMPSLVRHLELAFESIAARPGAAHEQGTTMILDNPQPPAPHVPTFSERIIGDLTLAHTLMQQGATREARVLCQRVLQEIPNQQAALEMLPLLDQRDHIDAAKRRFPGPQYLDWLQWLHVRLKPATYLEIGVETGQSLRFAQGATKAVGVDPEIHIVHSQECWVKLFRQTSDDFFAQHDLRRIFDGQAVDFAFIDGLHTFDQALKDFANIERYAHAGTVVAFHDVFPVSPATALRDRKSIFWLGDTWKVVPILKELRPDLKIFTVPAFPSGLTLVTGLNSAAPLSAPDLERAIARWMTAELDPYLADIDLHLNAIPNDYQAASALLAA